MFKRPTALDLSSCSIQGKRTQCGKPHIYAPARDLQKKQAFTLIEIVLSIALMSTCLALFSFSLVSYLRKRDFINDTRQIQSYFEDAVRLTHSTQHEVDILLQSVPTGDQGERVAISLLLWGAPAGEVKKRLEAPTIFKSIIRFTIDQGNAGTLQTKRGDTSTFIIRFFPREIEEDLKDASIHLYGTQDTLEHTINFSSLWEKVRGPSDIFKHSPIPSNIEQEALGE